MESLDLNIKNVNRQKVMENDSLTFDNMCESFIPTVHMFSLVSVIQVNVNRFSHLFFLWQLADSLGGLFIHVVL